jgi:putative transposase
MPRPLRIHLAGGFYHVTLRGNHRRDIFVAEHDRHLLNAIVARAIEKYGTRVHAYCWMSNHLHFLIQVADAPLAGLMRQIAAEFARAMQLKINTTGHFFERRYHATLVEANSYLLELIRYIHLNPVRAGLVRDPAQFPWSSHHSYIGSKRQPWVTTDFVLPLFGASRASALVAYRAFLDCNDAESWTPPTQLESMGILGSEEFIASVQRVSPAPGKRGTVDDLIAEACGRFEVHADDLISLSRDPQLSKVRAWIARQGVKRGIASVAAIARLLGRDESTLRQAIRTYPAEPE